MCDPRCSKISQNCNTNYVQHFATSGAPRYRKIVITNTGCSTFCNRRCNTIPQNGNKINGCSSGAPRYPKTKNKITKPKIYFLKVFEKTQNLKIFKRLNFRSFQNLKMFRFFRFFQKHIFKIFEIEPLRDGA